MTTLTSNESPRSQTPPEPTPLRKQAHYKWVTSPPSVSPVSRILYVGSSCLDRMRTLFDESELTSFRSAFRAHYWLEQLSSQPKSALPEAILCDLSLADGSAFMFFDRIRRMPHLRNIPFFAISPHFSRDEAVMALTHGMDDIFDPTVKRSDLSTRIEFLRRIPKHHHQYESDSISLQEFQPSGMKRMLDVWVAFLSLIFLSPLLFLITCLIKLSSRGPVFQITKYAGIGYNVFHFYKFRTKRIDSAQGELTEDYTPLGRWLAKSNLDELPQLINILQGDMSLVGNRPLPLHEAELLTTDQWSKRFLAPAGVTGLWQIARRTQKHLSEMDRRQLDVDYADYASFRHDLLIIYKTIMILLRRSSE